MSLPVLLVIDADLAALEDVTAQLVRRYGHDYRVEGAVGPEEALRELAALADAGIELALVLTARSLADATGGGLLERARELHPHAKCGLMVAWDALADPPTAEAIVDAIAFPRGVSGSRMAELAHEQAAVFGASFVFMHRATALTRASAGGPLTLTLADGRSVDATAVVLATGASYRRLDVPSLEALNGAGVFYGGPASLAHALSGSDVFVAGGANSAGQAALHLARYARRVVLVVRGAALEAGMSHYLIQEIQATSNIDVRTRTTIVGGGGGDGRRGSWCSATARAATRRPSPATSGTAPSSAWRRPSERDPS